VLQDFFSQQPSVPRVSTLESHRFSLNICRLIVAFDDQASDAELAQLCHASSSDLLIVRASASRYSLANALSNISSRRTIHADTLLYFQKSLKDTSPSPQPHSMGLLQTSEHTAFQQLVRNVFPNYANHYSANPMFDQALCLDGYVEWASSLVNNDTGHVFVSRTPAGQLASFIAIQGEGNTAEIALNGTAPGSQGFGIYSDLLTYACAELGAMGFSEINTSTQSSNDKVIRTWIRNGFNYVTAINTYHVVRVA
jgi:ribosomal protein S18 acetylase RimI-like enzyme